MKHFKKRTIRWVFIISLLLLLTIGYAFISYIAPALILIPYKQTAHHCIIDYNVKYDTLRVETEDQLVLFGYYVHAQTPTVLSTIICLHGKGGLKEHYIPLAEELSNRGHNVVIFDQRAHGESEGKYCTYGYYEKRDVQSIIDTIRVRYPKTKIGVWGTSLGGAVALQAMQVDKRIDFGIVGSTFTNLENIIYDYADRLLNIQTSLILEPAIQNAEKLANFSIDEVKPVESVKHIRQPILLMHGEADERIDVAYGKTLFANLKSEQKELILVEGGKHNGLLAHGGAELKEKVYTFINKIVLETEPQ